MICRMIQPHEERWGEIINEMVGVFFLRCGKSHTIEDRHYYILNNYEIEISEAGEIRFKKTTDKNWTAGAVNDVVKAVTSNA